ncbi:MAG TPA: DUF3180 domain-containing protein [Nocardioidaceae bacterium]|nr:DUF3180 domain-containing protein [Nocardioidaceae bacterium]
MSRDPDPRLDPDEDRPDDDRPPEGRIKTTPPGALVGFGVAGLVVGWVLRLVTIAIRGYAPTVGWLPVLALFLVAAIIGYVAYVTHRDVHRRGDGRARLEPHQAVNRLVLAKACGLAGAAVAGGYFGFALSWVGVASHLAGQRIVHSVLAGVAALLIMVGSLLLERACRVSGPPK